MSIEIRPAREGDAGRIIAMVRGERLNPTGLAWPRFHVADEAGEIVGAAQLRPGGPELGSVVVRADRRGRGVAGRLVEAVLGRVEGPVYLITTVELAGLYRRHGFVRIPARIAPGWIRLNLLIARASVLVALARRRPAKRMILMARRAAERAEAPRRAA